MTGVGLRRLGVDMEFDMATVEAIIVLCVPHATIDGPADNPTLIHIACVYEVVASRDLLTARYRKVGFVVVRAMHVVQAGCTVWKPDIGHAVIVSLSPTMRRGLAIR